jgi:hypothetical protein
VKANRHFEGITFIFGVKEQIKQETGMKQAAS